MDLSKFRTSDWLKVGGGGAMLIGFFLNWWQIDFFGGSIGVNGSDYFFTGVVPFLVLVGIAVLTVLTVAAKISLPATLPVPLIVLAAAALSTLLVFFRFLSDGVDGRFDGGLERGPGIFVALAAAIATTAGAVMGFKEAGGDLNDLKDVNKIKSAFDQSGSSSGGEPAAGSSSTDAPPPPPPSS
jgi:hypothetical protein